MTWAAVQAICCQLRAIADAANGKPQYYSGHVLSSFRSTDLYEILCATGDAYEALRSAIALAEERERGRASKRGPPLPPVPPDVREIGYVPPEGGAA
jgi:hypothetical protein